MGETKEKRIRNLAMSYYSRKDIQEAIFNFCKKRETIGRHEDQFGKRPDVLEYPSEITNLAKKGFTSFHCSEELWENPLLLNTNMDEKEKNNLREGWDLLIDIDSKYLDFSKITAELIIQAFRFHGLRNFKTKFSVSGDTSVLIKNKGKISLIPIEKAISLIKKGDSLKVLSLDKNQKLKLSQVYDYLEHEDILYEIKHGHSKIPLKATAHHSVFVFEDGQIAEKKVSELKKGDFLVTFNSKKNPLESGKDEVINNFQLGNRYYMKKYKKKIKITKELMRLIGYYLSEGHVTNVINQVGFTFNKNEKKYIDDCQKLLKQITNKKISIRHPNKNSTQILIHSKEWATFFENFCGKAKNKHVPSFSFEISKDLFLEMLIGYIRGDGHKIGEYTIAAKSVAYQLIRELVWLCNLNGISCSLSNEQGKPHKLPQGNAFKGSFVYILKIPKSELAGTNFNRSRNKFSPFPRDRTFPVQGLKKVYYQIKPKMFNYHRKEQMTLKKKRANLKRIKKVINWFNKFKSEEFSEKSKTIIRNYEKLFNSDIGTVEVKSIKEMGKKRVYDLSVEETESFFGNDYPILLHNSGSKGFHIIVPWKAFPKEIYNQKAKDMFPDWPRTIIQYLKSLIDDKLVERVSELTMGKGASYVKDYQASKEVIPDLVLVSSRHLFRAPYSLHEKGLSSIVIEPEEIQDFQPKEANPLKAKVKEFYPDAKEGEAKELLVTALDWLKNQEEDKKPTSNKNFSKVEIDKTNIVYPPCIKKILEGMEDGKKRSLFVLINYFKSLNLEWPEIEERVKKWNEKNREKGKALDQSYLNGQLNWHKKKKSVLPPNCDKDYYKGMGICNPDQTCKKIKNPVNYSIRKQFSRKRNSKK